MEQKQLKSIFDKYYTYNNSIEQVIQKLKDSGATQMECTKTLISELKISLTDADRIVVESIAWSDVKSNVQKLRDDMYNWGKENLSE